MALNQTAGGVSGIGIIPFLFLLALIDFLAVFFGFDHGVGHPLLLLCNAKAHNHRKSEGFKHLDNYSEWPKVADVVIEASFSMLENSILVA
jgi:hypothetical protein